MFYSIDVYQALFALLVLRSLHWYGCVCVFVLTYLHLFEKKCPFCQKICQIARSIDGFHFPVTIT